MSLPEEARAHYINIVAKPKPKVKEYTSFKESFQVSSDWTKIVIDEDVPLAQEQADNSLHIKVGNYEFKAGADFPLEKLSELLRGLADVS
jgi:hypothetical protein